LKDLIASLSNPTLEAVFPAKCKDDVATLKVTIVPAVTLPVLPKFPAFEAENSVSNCKISEKVAEAVLDGDKAIASDFETCAE
jgi:hypothetical protein